MTKVRVHPVEDDDRKFAAVCLAQDVAAEESVDGKAGTRAVIITLSELDHVITALTELLALANRQEK